MEEISVADQQRLIYAKADLEKYHMDGKSAQNILDNMIKYIDSHLKDYELGEG